MILLLARDDQGLSLGMLMRPEMAHLYLCLNRIFVMKMIEILL